MDGEKGMCQWTEFSKHMKAIEGEIQFAYVLFAARLLPVSSHISFVNWL